MSTITLITLHLIRHILSCLIKGHSWSRWNLILAHFARSQVSEWYCVFLRQLRSYFTSHFALMIFPPAPLKMLFSDQHGMKNFLNIILHARKKNRKKLGSKSLPVMAAITVRKKVVIVGHFPSSLCPQSLQHFLFVRLNYEQLYDRKWTKTSNSTLFDKQVCS